MFREEINRKRSSQKFSEVPRILLIAARSFSDVDRKRTLLSRQCVEVQQQHKSLPLWDTTLISTRFFLSQLPFPCIFHMLFSPLSPSTPLLISLFQPLLVLTLFPSVWGKLADSLHINCKHSTAASLISPHLCVHSSHRILSLLLYCSPHSLLTDFHPLQQPSSASNLAYLFIQSVTKNLFVAVHCISHSAGLSGFS